jgi:uncharacterized protein YjeT (DUF2065 family)
LTDLFAAIGLVLVLEGCLYALFPGGVKRMMEMAQRIPDGTLRIGGLLAAVFGLFVVWLARNMLT